MLTFSQFVAETKTPEHLLWYLDNHGLKATITKDRNMLHADMWAHDKLPKSQVWNDTNYHDLQNLYNNHPRGRALINHKGKRITHTDYGWGRNQEIDARLKKKYPDYVQSGTEARSRPHEGD